MRVRLFALMVVVAVAGTGTLCAQPLADKLPADTVAYVGWQGASSPGAGYAGSHLQAILEGSNLPQLFTDFIPRGAALLAQKDKDFAEALPMIAAVAGPLWKYPSAIYVGGLDVAQRGGPPMPKVAVLIQAGGDADAVLRGVQGMLAKMKGGDAPPVVAQARDGLVVVAFGKTMPASLVASIGGNGTLAENAAFKSAMAQTVKQPFVAVYVNLEEVWKTIDRLAPAMAPTTQHSDEPSWPQIRDALGLPGLKAVAMAEGFDGKDWAGGAFVSAPAPRTGFLKALEGAPVDDAFLKVVPKTSLSVISGRFRPAAILDLARAVWPMLPKNDVPPLEGVLQQISGVLGFDVEKDFLGSFGDEWVAYTDVSVGGTGLVGTALVHRASNAAKLEQSMGMIEQFANNVIAANLKEPGMTVSFKTQQVGDLKLHYLAAPIVTPTWAFKDGYLFVGMWPQTVVGAVAASTKGGPSILENEQFVAIRKRLGDVKASTIEYHDLARMVPETYGPWVVISRYVGMADLFGMDSPLMMLPPMQVVLDNVGPAGAVSWTDDAGFHARDVSPFPGSTALASDPIRAYMSAAPAMAVSVLLPSLSKAKETANRAKDASNLRQIGQGCMLWANENNGRYPQDLGHMAMGEDLTLPVLLSPLSGRTVPPEVLSGTPDARAKWINENSDYEYLGAGTSVAKMTADKPMAHTKLQVAAAHGGMNILFGDGHVEWWMLSAAEDLLNKGK